MKKRVQKELEPGRVPDNHAGEPQKSGLLSPSAVYYHPPGALLLDATVFVLLLLATVLVSNYLAFLNVTFLFVRWGSLLLLALLVATVLYGFRLLSHAGHGIASLKNQYKLVLFAIVLLVAVVIYVNQATIMPLFIRMFWGVPWASLNPVDVWYVP